MQNLKYLLPISGKSVFKKRLVIHYTGLNNTQSLSAIVKKLHCFVLNISHAINI